MDGSRRVRVFILTPFYRLPLARSYNSPRMPIGRLTAVTRKVSARLAACELEFLTRQEIDLAKAIQQHHNYEATLAELGANVVSLPAEDQLPDSVFVEDPAIVLDEVAVITRMGAEIRRPEAPSLAAALSRFRELKWMQEPATLEGGDVVRIGKTLYVGVSRRTNRPGIAQLADLIGAFGYSVVPVPVHGCLHLKTACCSLGGQTVLANRELFDSEAFAGIEIVDVPASEPWAADVLEVDGTVLESAQFPETCALLERRGFRVKRLDVSELHKAEAGVTCMSILFEAAD
jgi:dimethylargininase